MMNPRWYRLLMLAMVLSITAVLITSCSEFALLASGSSIAVSQNAYVKAYNGIDVLTIVKTDKDIKRHLYDQIKDAKKRTRTQVGWAKSYFNK
jgi:hypothetical protein|tara:strand:- start:399 stop:677 length:279 start_codon:yes stop_codon:yes gene_type:complete